MKLHSNPASPYGRKVKVVAYEKGLSDRLQVHTVTTTAVGPDLGLVADNPLAKIPCLVLEDGVRLFDSRVISEYLDSLAEAPRLLPAVGAERWDTLRLQALADGLLDAALLVRYETFLRPKEFRWPAWIDGQLDKITRALDRLEAVDAPGFGGRLDLGTITVGCALGYLDFRFADLDWRADRPALADWFASFATRPSMQATKPG
ncbi:MAG: glutathione S-transferase family protein [Geminicoccaceae bacterium]